MQGLRELVLDGGSARLLGRAAAGGDDARERDRSASEGGALEQLSPGELVVHSAPSVESTTNVESGLHEISPGVACCAPGSLFWT